jgi:hypothetical protein
MPDPITHGANAATGGALGALIASTFGVSLPVVLFAAFGSIMAVALMQKFSLRVGFLIITSGTAAASFLTPWLHSLQPLINENGIAFFVAAGGIAFWGKLQKAVSEKIEKWGEK